MPARNDILNKSCFLHVKCKKCKNQQVIFNRCATHVKCLVCGAILAEATGGKARVKANILRVLH